MGACKMTKRADMFFSKKVTYIYNRYCIHDCDQKCPFDAITVLYQAVITYATIECS
jgi:hypothetical protein